MIMNTRDIVDAEGNVIGSVALPENATDAQWDKALSAYTTPTPIGDVTPRQIRQVMVLNGISVATIETALSTLPEPLQSLAKIEWEYSVAFQRHRPLVIQMGALLGFTSDQLDALWKQAAAL